ncbi:MAG: ABC-F type ribosomal protection protein [Lachnospiraceae bacterium]|nr:ABC-F type ribosomal protection protein [Lachnospiraceae bacterium]
MSLISVNHLTFYYEGSFDNVFEDVSFQIDSDWRLGFVARNGRGKTTFLNLLMGKYEYRGSITASEKFDYFPFEVEDASKNTLEIVDGIFPDNEFWKICRELTLLQVDAEVLYRPFETLSFGEQTKVMLAVLFSMEEHFLLIDEPTNHLDAPARELVRDYLKQKKGFILVSHDRDFLDQCIDHVLVINKTNIEVFQGNFSTWWENKNRRDAFELAENEKLKKEIGRLEASARRTADWAKDIEASKIGKRSDKIEWAIDSRAYIGEKSRRMSQRRKNLERRQTRAIEEKSALLHNIESAEVLKLFPQRHHKEVLVKMEDVRISYGSKMLPAVNLEIRNGDRVVLQGANGCGKSSVIKALLQAVSYTGTANTASGLIISYVSQDTSHLNGTLAEYAEAQGIDLTVFLALLRKLDFSRAQFEKKMEDYSGGQKKKVLLAASLCKQAHLYIWDEPLNFIDVFSRMQLESLILEFKPTMLLVEHDKTFVEKVATKNLLIT